MTQREFKSQGDKEDDIDEHPWELSYNQDSSEFYDDKISDILQHSSSHRRSLSNEMLMSSYLSQQNYHHNHISLLQSIEDTNILLNDLIIENDERPIHIPDNSLEILQLNLRLEGDWSGNLQLDKDALSQIFESQANSALDHLQNLQQRVHDTSSKVFITGDLNSGKSTLCNALLRKRVLPEDQLPCTNVFCEILEARENNNIEEVHAIPFPDDYSIKELNINYNIRDRSTYEVFPLSRLNDLVYMNKKYILLKCYIKDNMRPIDSSLLRNGTVDISLIDSPGLNLDSVQTTKVMSRQEEIDLVIFVVNAENQLTLSAQNFISMASREKKLMFFIVNKFDQIKDKERCKKLILNQIKELSPETYKKSQEFIHFVSSAGKFPNNHDGDGPGNDKDPADHNNEISDPDFDRLDNSLRNFVLKKRSLSKLLPAKTYLIKLLQDIENIAKLNITIYKQEDKELNDKLTTLQPDIQSVKYRCRKLTDSVDLLSDNAVNDTYNYTKAQINGSLVSLTKEFPIYEGLSMIHDYIFRTRKYILAQINSSIRNSEIYAMQKTEEVVNNINLHGKTELGDEFMANRTLQSDLMFTKKKHSIGKQLNIPFLLGDLFAPSLDGFLSYLSWGVISYQPSEIDSDNHINTRNWTNTLGLNTYAFSQYWSNPSLIFTSKVPTLALYSFGSIKVVTNFIVYGTRFFTWQSFKTLFMSLVVIGSVLSVGYLIHDIPHALPINLTHRYTKKLKELDYAHVNADRISREVREVLNFPIREIVKSCELIIDKKQSVKKELEGKLLNNSMSVKFFQKLSQKTVEQKNFVQKINLDID